MQPEGFESVVNKAKLLFKLSVYWMLFSLLFSVSYYAAQKDSLGEISGLCNAVGGHLVTGMS